MIKDNLKYAETYYGISEELKNGFEWLKSHDLKNIEPGKYLIGDDGCYVNIEEYETKQDAKYEAHNKFIDIQYMINGKERIGVCDKQNCKVCIEYDENKDIEFLDNVDEDNWEFLHAGNFMVFFPNDAHKPSINPDKRQAVKKAVVKIKIV